MFKQFYNYTLYDDNFIMHYCDWSYLNFSKQDWFYKLFDNVIYTYRRKNLNAMQNVLLLIKYINDDSIDNIFADYLRDRNLQKYLVLL